LVLIHKVIGYRKFGDKALERGYRIIHIDGNKLNNADDNLELFRCKNTSAKESPSVKAMKEKMYGAHPRRPLTRYNPAEVINHVLAHRSFNLALEQFNIKRGELVKLLTKSPLLAELNGGKKLYPVPPKP